MNREPTSQHVDLSAELAQAARALSEANLNKAHPADTHALLQDLHETIDSLKQVAAQLSWWHSRAIRGSDYGPADNSGVAVEDAAAQLLAASRFLSAARDAAGAAEGANNAVRWKRRPSPGTTLTSDDTDLGSIH